MVEESKLEKKMGKLTEKLSETFISEVKEMKPDQLKESALKYAKVIENVDDEKSNDAKLQAVLSQKKDLEAGYKETKKYAKMKMQYILGTMKLNGVE